MSPISCENLIHWPINKAATYYYQRNLMFSDVTKLFERVLFLDESLRQLPTPKIDRDPLGTEWFPVLPSPTEYFSCERTLSWLSVCVRHLWFWKKTKIEESRTKQRGGRRRPLRYIREFVRYQEGDTGENVTKQWLRLIWKLQRARLSQLAHFAKYRRTLLALNWQEKCPSSKRER